MPEKSWFVDQIHKARQDLDAWPQWMKDTVNDSGEANKGRTETSVSNEKKTEKREAGGKR